MAHPLACDGKLREFGRAYSDETGARKTGDGVLGPVGVLARPLAEAIGSSTEITQGKSEFVRMGRRPGEDAFELRKVVPDKADLD